MDNSDKIPNAYDWFAKLKLTRFIPWHFDEQIDFESITNDRFEIEHNENRKVVTFGRRQDRDTCAGFEIVDGKLRENVVVFHPSYSQNTKRWDIIESEHTDFFTFMLSTVLPDMKDWIVDDEVDDYVD